MGENPLCIRVRDALPVRAAHADGDPLRRARQLIDAGIGELLHRDLGDVRARPQRRDERG